jgi:hypothetical protein
VEELRVGVVAVADLQAELRGDELEAARIELVAFDAADGAEADAGVGGQLLLGEPAPLSFSSDLLFGWSGCWHNARF